MSKREKTKQEKRQWVLTVVILSFALSVVMSVLTSLFVDSAGLLVALLALIVLISIGVIGLIKAVDSFKSASGTPLGTYAARCIENEILMTLRASRKRRGDVSLSDPVGSDGEGNDITYQDILGTDADELENTVIRRVTAGKVQQVLHRLPARERFVLELRYGLTDGRQHPQHEIARRLGISRSYVSRVEKKAVALLRDEIER